MDELFILPGGGGGGNMKISNTVGDERKTILQHFQPVNSVVVSQDFMAMGIVVH